VRARGKDTPSAGHDVTEHDPHGRAIHVEILIWTSLLLRISILMFIAMDDHSRRIRHTWITMHKFRVVRKNTFVEFDVEKQCMSATSIPDFFSNFFERLLCLPHRWRNFLSLGRQHARHDFVFFQLFGRF